MAATLLRSLPLVLLLLSLTAPPATTAAALSTAPAPAAAKNATIDSATLSLADLTLLGDSFLRNGSVGLTRDTGVPSSSAGSVLCTQPVALRGPNNNGTNATASFAARFSFVIDNPNAGAAGGDGIAFFVSPGRAALGATGGYLGLFNSSSSGNDSAAIVAVEFDTMANPEFADPSDNHVGLDLGSPVSVAAADLAASGIDLKSGNLTTAWIDYRGADRRLELSAATRGFHASRVVGKGAFGTVYKATMPGATATTYAVKRSTQAHQSRSEFVAELSVIACLRHKNLVQLEGWCDEKGELLLVYEYMPNGSLDRALYGDPCTLTWPQRYAVAAGIASVLSYLHQECEQRVIHRDIKTSNILLDANLSPRLGDFGLARLMDHNKSPVSTLTAGTMGYLAPEYLQSGKATEQTDVFSYGVVVLEVCCGRRPIDKDDGGGKNVNLVDWVWRLHGEDRLIEAADARLAGEFDRDEMLRLLLVGLSCANPNCEERPAMRRVVQILNREAEPVPVPRKKPLLVFSSSASMKLQEIAFSCGDDVRGGYSVAKLTSPRSEGGDIER
ncbi:unnamed protein product [Urochloa humidicola]